MAANQKAKQKGGRKIVSRSSVRFEAADVEALFPVLDAVAWVDLPAVGTISQFAGIDPRTTGKLLKNCLLLNLIEAVNGDRYNLRVPYPAKGNDSEKQAVVREALIRLPLMASYHQFRQLGDTSDDALRKAATIQGIEPYQPSDLTPVLNWAKKFGVLDSAPQIEQLVNEATQEKRDRKGSAANETVVFISHSSRDKPVIRRITSDLTRLGMQVWLDEQSILVGDSITEKISQGLAKSDFFVIAISKQSLQSNWVQRELNAALMSELSRRSVQILPIRLDEAELPALLADRKYADFSRSYQDGFRDLKAALEMKSRLNNE